MVETWRFGTIGTDRLSEDDRVSEITMIEELALDELIGTKGGRD